MNAAILAGGRGQRLGGVQKAFIEVDGITIVDRQLEVLRPRFARIAVVLAAGDDDAPFLARGLEVARDAVSGAGPIAGLAWSDGAPLFAIACDMPFVNGDVVDLVVARGADLALPITQGGAEPLFACYGPRCRALVDAALVGGERRLVALPEAARERGLTVEEISDSEIRTIDPELRSFTNINEPSDRIWIEPL
jgi:molybdopterin-guanine dinucleotide biosynthesis protein A